MQEKDYNYLGVWLRAKLAARQVSISKFVLLMKYAMTNATVFRWLNDTYRPEAEHMKLVCQTLSELPVRLPDGTEYFEDVPWSEGLAQYTPRPKGWIVLKDRQVKAAKKKSTGKPVRRATNTKRK